VVKWSKASLFKKGLSENLLRKGFIENVNFFKKGLSENLLRKGFIENHSQRRGKMSESIDKGEG